MLQKILDYFSNRTHKFKVGDKVIYVNIFGVVYLWTIEELTTYTLHTGEVMNAYHPEGTQTPWFPFLESDLHKASKRDLRLSPQELQAMYGFTPTEYYGCY